MNNKQGNCEVQRNGNTLGDRSRDKRLTAHKNGGGYVQRAGVATKRVLNLSSSARREETMRSLAESGVMTRPHPPHQPWH